MELGFSYEALWLLIESNFIIGKSVMETSEDSVSFAQIKFAIFPR